MKEKIRLLQEGKRVVLIIEDSTPADLEKVKQVFGDILTSSVVEGIENVPARDIPVPEPNFNAPPRQPQRPQEQQRPQQQNNAPYRPIVFSKGKYAGRTLGDVMACDCGYVKWLAEKGHQEFRWQDLFFFMKIWHDNCVAPTTPFQEVIYMVQTFDMRPNASSSLQIEICEALGVQSLQAIKNELDEIFVRNLLQSAIERLQ